MKPTLRRSTVTIACIEEDGEQRCCVDGATTNEDCESPARHLEKHWGASFVKDYDVGADARYVIEYAGKAVILRHAAQRGNDFTCADAPARDVIAEPFATLQQRLE